MLKHSVLLEADMTVREGGRRPVTGRSHDELSHDLRLCVLGPVEVCTPLGPVVLTRAQERALLAALALFHDRVRSTDRLVDALWGDRHPGARRRHFMAIFNACAPALVPV
jgi:hypothetical protein